ncbi:hypothetical protein [Metaclostridioides mangenotii]|uniref:hypothetical protein n=1 Tax=Metaclostridioides mangenotii TaxID=1540 RepID=UPI0028F0BF3A|nr:hypothetical protein [Clostridioides mangenotii]
MYKYGETKVHRFIDSSIIKEMPIQAFDSIKKRIYDIGLVPSVFAKIGRINKDLDIIWPKDGAISIQSYIAINKSVSLEVVEILRDEVFNSGFVDFFVNRGDIISCLLESEETVDSVENKFNFTYPNDEWFAQLDYNEFIDKYNKITRV